MEFNCSDFAQVDSIENRNPSWQCVLICWGTKYGTAIINNLVRHIACNASSVPRFVLITDIDTSDLVKGVLTVKFPEFWLQEPLRRSGCQAKLVMFEKGILQDDLPAIYVDLDTLVLGDLEQGLSLMDSPNSVVILPSAIIPFGKVGRWCYQVTRGRRYARGNSSFVIFHPAKCHYIASQFRRLFSEFPNLNFRPMAADERFISWVAQRNMKAIPRSFAVKFPGEFMFFWGWWLYIRALMPWTRSRRRSLVGVTLNGLHTKPENLIDLPEGARIVDEKGRVLIWSHRTLGSMQQKICQYYRDLY